MRSQSVCFISGARYSQPLDKTSEKKFRALKVLGELFIIGFSQDLCARRFTEHARFYLLPKLPVPVLRYAEVFIMGMPLALWLIFRHGVRVLIAQSPYEGLVGALAKKIAGRFKRDVVLVVESHGDFEESLFMQRRILLPGLYRLLMRHVARFSLSHADLLRAISNSTKEQLKEWLPGKLIIQFPGWTDIEVFLEADANGEGRSCQDILYAGVLIPRKGVHHVINAFASIAKDFPRPRLVVVGGEENKTYAAELKNQVERLGLKECVQFVAEVTQPELAALMRKSCVFVLPSISEGLGRVLVEAMATGTPVIGSDVGGIPEMVQNGVTGFLVPPGDEAALAERLKWVLKHPNEACEMGHRSRAFAQQLFSTEVYLGGFRQIFEIAQGLLARQNKNAHSTL